jgi:hypothetical protein
MPDPAAERRGHELRDVNARGVALFAAGLVAAAVIIHLGVIGLYKALEAQHPSPDAPSRIALHPHMLAPPPQLQTSTAADLEKFEAAENATLHGYGWVDKSAGIVRIPIERAMELTAERGLPTRGPGTQNASGITAVEMQKRKAEATRP